jgi:peroxiredoxin Q/BCP
MTQLVAGDKAPKFNGPTDGGGTASLGDFSGRYLVIYFYPKDDTPGCTKEAIGFTEQVSAFSQLGAEIIGVSKDTVAKHDKFIAKHNLGIRLISDEDGEMVESYGVWVEKNMYGKKYMGIERATYLVGPDEVIVQVWRKVRVKGHVDAVLAALKSHVDNQS